MDNSGKHLERHYKKIIIPDGSIKPNETVIIEVPPEFKANRTFLATRRQPNSTYTRSPVSRGGTLDGTRYRNGVDSQRICSSFKASQSGRPINFNVCQAYQSYYVFVDNFSGSVPEAAPNRRYSNLLKWLKSTPPGCSSKHPCGSNSYEKFYRVLGCQGKNWEIHRATCKNCGNLHSGRLDDMTFQSLLNETPLNDDSKFQSLLNETPQTDFLDEKHTTFHSLLNETPRTDFTNEGHTIFHSLLNQTPQNSSSESDSTSEKFQSLLNATPVNSSSSEDDEHFQSLLDATPIDSFSHLIDETDRTMELSKVKYLCNILDQLDNISEEFKEKLMDKLHVVVLKAVPIALGPLNSSYGPRNISGFAPQYTSTPKKSGNYSSQRSYTIGDGSMYDSSSGNIDDSLMGKILRGEVGRVLVWPTPPSQRVNPTYNFASKNNSSLQSNFGTSTSLPSREYSSRVNSTNYSARSRVNSLPNRTVNVSNFAPPFPITTTRTKYGGFNYTRNLTNPVFKNRTAVVPSTTSFATNCSSEGCRNRGGNSGNATYNVVSDSSNTSLNRNFSNLKKLTCSSYENLQGGKKVSMERSTTTIETYKEEGKKNEPPKIIQTTLKKDTKATGLQPTLSCSSEVEFKSSLSSLRKTVDLNELREIEKLERNQLEKDLRRMQEARRQLAIHAAKIGSIQ